MKRQRLNELRKLEETLAVTGVARLRKRGLRPEAMAFPDLSVVPSPYPSGPCFAPVRGKHEPHTDARTFPVGHLHKSSLQLITASDDLAYYAGKKP